jgi:hypothetical protein
MKRFLLIPLALSLMLASLAFSTRASAAPTDDPLKTCIDDWNGLEYVKDSTKAKEMIKSFNKTTCGVAKGGKCQVHTETRGSKQYSKITCDPLTPAGGTPAPSGSGVECATSSSICLSGLPHTGADRSTIEKILRIVIGITAAISVLFIAIGGVRYIISQGEPQAVSKAKSTIVYALIGLVVAIVAQAIVAFVINGVSS